MRILVGTFEICRHVFDLADGFRQLRHEVDSAVAFRNPFCKDLPYTIDFHQQRMHHQFVRLLKDPLGAFLEMPAELQQMRRLLLDYDVYVFVFGHSLLPGNQDFPLLKKLSKKIISIFEGSDVRHWSGAEPVGAAYGYKLPAMYREAPYDMLHARMQNMRMAERYSDAIFSLPFQSELAIRPYSHFFLPVNLDLYTHFIPERDVPVLVHAPSRRGFKGTDVFLATLDRLREEGVAFELRLLEKVSNREVLDALVDADIVLDELNAPHYGMLALEGMASGCAVVAGRNLDYVPMQGESPVCQARIDNLYEPLKRLLTDKAYRVSLAKQGRAFVQRQHSHTEVAAQMLADIGETGPFDYYPSFVAKHYDLPAGEVLQEHVKRLTSEVVQRHGLPKGVSVESLHARGLLDAAAMKPERPVLPWRSAASFGVEEQVWGWSPGAKKSMTWTGDGAEAPQYRITELVDQALGALDRQNMQGAVAILQACITHYQADPQAFDDADVLVALGRLAAELNHASAAQALFTQALHKEPHRADVQQALGALAS